MSDPTFCEHQRQRTHVVSRSGGRPRQVVECDDCGATLAVVRMKRMERAKVAEFELVEK